MHKHIAVVLSILHIDGYKKICYTINRHSNTKRGKKWLTMKKQKSALYAI